VAVRAPSRDPRDRRALVDIGIGRVQGLRKKHTPYDISINQCLTATTPYLCMSLRGSGLRGGIGRRSAGDLGAGVAGRVSTTTREFLYVDVYHGTAAFSISRSRIVILIVLVGVAVGRSGLVGAGPSASLPLRASASVGGSDRGSGIARVRRRSSLRSPARPAGGEVARTPSPT
jgi:hypothetical protein